MAVKIEIVEKTVAVVERLLYIDGRGPFGALEFARCRLARLSQSGRGEEVRRLIQKHGGTRLSDVPFENYEAFIEEIFNVF